MLGRDRVDPAVQSDFAHAHDLFLFARAVRIVQSWSTTFLFAFVFDNIKINFYIILNILSGYC